MMTRGRKKAEEKQVDEKPSEEVKPSGISLIVFKEIQGIDNMVYAGFKASLGADDGTEYTQTELEKKFEEYKVKDAFIQK